MRGRQRRHGCSHDRGHRPRRARRSLLGYFRQRLRRRLFLWFGVAIALTVGLSGGVAWLTGGNEPWAERIAAVTSFTAHRFEAVWGDPSARDELARAVADDLEIGITLVDSDGNELSHHDPRCEHPHTIAVAAGHVELCTEQWSGAAHRSAALPFVVGGIILWIAAGFIAYRLTRPLAQLVNVTRELGQGNLDARMRGRVSSGELRAIAEAINDMADRIQKLVGAERELLASVSHEIRTPLAHIRVLLETAKERDPKAPLVDELELEVTAIDSLVGQLLARSRIAFDTLDRHPLDAVELGLRALERSGLDPTLLEADAESLMVHADAGLVLQALANLLRNAEEHGGGVTGLRLRSQADELRFEVTDAGPGFKPGEVDHAFERGYQGADGRGSLGLGLALVRRIARAHEGDAFVENLQPGACVGFSVRVA